MQHVYTMMHAVALSHAKESCMCGLSITKEGLLFLCEIYIQRDDGSVLSYIIERDGGVERVCS